MLATFVGKGWTDESPCFLASAWPEADRLFRNSHHWLGGDDAFSVDLGNERTLWLFGDSWVDARGRGSRHGARLVKNSIAIQVGPDPSDARIEYFWGREDDGTAAAFFHDGEDGWYWPGHGARVGDRLLIFLNHVRAVDGGLGFESAGWRAVVVENPSDHPTDWRIDWLETPGDPMGIQLGFAGVLVHGGHLHALGSPDPDKSHPIYAARWPLEMVAQGRLMNPEWWRGTPDGWSVADANLHRRPILEGGQSEMTFHYDERTSRFVAIHTVGFGPARLVLRTSPALTGPWTDPEPLFTPPEFSRPNVMIYAGKAHPQLTGADLVLTYATNSFEFSEHFTDQDIYYPRFVRGTRCPVVTENEKDNKP